MRRCWECEVEAVPIVEAILPVPEGDGPVIGLCPACFESVYLALVSSLQEDSALSPQVAARR
jgi:hypothetical protein